MASGSESYQQIVTVEADPIIASDMDPVHVQVIRKTGEFYNTVQMVVSLHHLGAVGGVLLIVNGLIGLFFGYSLGLTGLQVLTEIFLTMFGAVIIFVEYPKITAMSKLRRKLFHFARFLFIPMGRGCFYIYITCCLLAQWPDIFDIVAAIYFAILAGLCVKVGLTTQKKLADLKESFGSVDDIKRKITEIRNVNFPPDLGNDPALPESLEKSEFLALCKDYGIMPGKNELDAMVLCLDADQDEKVGYDEICMWWEHDI